ncbi:methyltransferase [Actinoplanes sp. NPDC051470]|uniref:methyltransferase n=1 Tax=Actinoplanes sp. NPDC051470 TaxID=3157224 RepID=UPI00341B9E9B
MSDGEPAELDVVRRLHALTDLVTPMALRTFVSLGLPDHLRDRPGTAAELAQLTSCNARILTGILEHLASREVVRAGPGGRYTLTALGRAACSTPAPSPQSWLVDSLRLGTLTGDVNHSVVALLDVVRSGRTGLEEHHGEPVWSRVARMDLDQTRTLFGHRTPVVEFGPIEKLVRAYAPRTVCDLGAGTGRLARELLTRRLCSHCHVVDLEPMISLADEMLDDIDHRSYSLHEADFMTDPLPAADLYVLCDILADWPDDDAIHLLGVVRKAAGVRPAVLVTQLILPGGAGDLFDPTAGRVRLDIEMARPARTVEEICALGAAAGLRVVSTEAAQHRSAVLLESESATP